MEYSRLTPVAEKFGAFQSLERELASAREMQDDSDAAMRDMGREEMARLAPEIERAEAELKALLIPRDPRDDKNIYLEVRAGTGGDEAAIFAGDLFRMYARYAETHGFTVEILSESLANMAAFAKSSAASRARARSRASSSNPACIACSACPPPKRRAASTPRHAPSPFLRRPTKSKPAI